MGCLIFGSKRLSKKGRKSAFGFVAVKILEFC